LGVQFGCTTRFAADRVRFYTGWGKSVPPFDRSSGRS
jgi:hypothetical protein